MGIVRFSGLRAQAGGYKRLPINRPNRCSSEDGHAVLEFAFVLPMMMAVITGLFSFGIALNNQLELTEAVGSGGQYLQQIQSITTDPCQDVATTVQRSATNLNAANLTLTLTMQDNNGNSTVESGPASSFSCAGAQSGLVSGGSATVAGTYPCSLFVYGLNFKNTCQLSAQVAEYEY
ncbi:MAG: TadE/TadG family type IV pilus assembly protein [Terracidiphilus sp.]